MPDAGHPSPRNAVDQFVMARLKAEKLTPAADAGRDVWLRRVTFDLTGLPPTLAELDAFARDRSPKAYDIVLDRLFASPRYGERMASDWLDLARYADTHGYQADRLLQLWPYRDWVIDAFKPQQAVRRVPDRTTRRRPAAESDQGEPRPRRRSTGCTCRTRRAASSRRSSASRMWPTASTRWARHSWA